MIEPEELPMTRGERIKLSLVGAGCGGLLVAAPTLLGWWIIWSGAQLDAIAALLGWR